jgi:hypothetical protein
MAQRMCTDCIRQRNTTVVKLLPLTQSALQHPHLKKNEKASQNPELIKLNAWKCILYTTHMCTNVRNTAQNHAATYYIVVDLRNMPGEEEKVIFST